MDPDYLQIDEDGGTLNKEQVLASFRSGERFWAEARCDEHRVQVYGDAAVVVGRWRARGQNGVHPFDYQARYVSMWIQRDGRWRMVSDQSTPTT